MINQAYETRRDNADWIVQIVEERKTRRLCDDIYAKLVDYVRVAREYELEVAPRKKQKIISELLCRALRVLDLPTAYRSATCSAGGSVGLEWTRLTR